MSEEEYENMTVAQLKEILKEKGLPVSGTKKSLIERLTENMETQEHEEESDVDIASLSAHPGLARTNLQPTTIAANGSWQASIVYKLMNPIFQSSRMGALSQLLAATDPNAISGEQYGPRFNLRGHPKLCEVASLALDSNERERLWEVSENLIGDFVQINQGKKVISKNK